MTPRSQGDQIRRALSELPTIQAKEDNYLKLEDALDVTEAILYPGGLKTEDQYHRLTAITKAGCRAIGYSDEEVALLPPLVSFRQRGTYLKKMPPITDEAIQAIIANVAANDYELISTPYLAITRKMVIGDIASQHWQKKLRELTSMKRSYLKERCDQVAGELGWSIRSFDSDPVWPGGQVGYAKPMTPNLEALQQAVSRQVNAGLIEIPILKMTGIQAAFADHVLKDPEEFISDESWGDLFNQLGYIYDPSGAHLIPKPLNLSANAQNTLAIAISDLQTYNHPTIGTFLIKDSVVQTAKETLNLTITQARLEQLLSDGIIGRVLIKLGYQTTTRWLSRHEFIRVLTKPQNFGTEVLLRAMQVDQELKTPQFAKGFPIHSPALVRDESTLVYMELLGPRQAVKANWANLRQPKKSRYFYGGRLEVTKEDKPITLKTTLGCGWDHWCLIHRQASYDKLTPQETFYLIDDNTTQSGPPPTFIPFLAKSLGVPILPEWAEYLWIEGRIKALISPLTKNCYGYGGWKVKTGKEAWNTMVSEGLGEKKINF
ncbi:MAG: hypothetical protein ACPGWR_10895 [Ardenticatenaceae bacterium]